MSSRSRDSSPNVGSRRVGAGGEGTGSGADSDGGSDQPSCNHDFAIDLTGVRADVAAAVVVGDRLDVQLRAGAPYDTVVCERSSDGRAVGSITAFAGLVSLIECLRRGVVYVADVLDAERTRCRVRVHRPPAA